MALLASPDVGVRRLALLNAVAPSVCGNNSRALISFSLSAATRRESPGAAPVLDL
jgi:hypothetical protein